MPAVSERRGGPRRALGNSDWMLSFRKSSSGIDGFLGDGTPIPKGDVERALSSGEQSGARKAGWLAWVIDAFIKWQI